MRESRARRLKADPVHGLDEALPVLGLVDRVLVGADQSDAVGFEDAFPDQIQRAVQRGLATHRRQQRVGAFLASITLAIVRHSTGSM